MSICFMFSGQGSQYVNMGKDLYDSYQIVRDIFNQANEILGYNLESIMFSDENKLNDTKYTQVAMFTLYASILKVLEKHNIKSDYSLGLSLGEYGALLHNEVFDFKKGLRIVKKRGELMSKAASNNNGCMSAVLGLDSSQLVNLIEQVDGYVKISNYNTYGQLVVSGEKSSVKELNILAMENGARRVIPLNTSGAFHSNLMEYASKEFSKYLKDIKLNEPKHNLLINVTGDFYHGEVKKVMSDQIIKSVRFYQMIEKLVLKGVNIFVEIGPKKTLCSFVRKMDRSLKTLNVEDNKSLSITIKELEGSYEFI